MRHVSLALALCCSMALGSCTTSSPAVAPGGFQVAAKSAPGDLVLSFTGGGWLDSLAEGGGKLSVNVNVSQRTGEAPKGQIQLYDHTVGYRYKSASFQSFSRPNTNAVAITGFMTTGEFFLMEAADNGEPGRDDFFTIEVYEFPATALLYGAIGNLQGGNFQIRPL